MRLTRRVLRGLISDEMLSLHESNVVQVGDDDDPSTLDSDDLRAMADKMDPMEAEVSVEVPRAPLPPGELGEPIPPEELHSALAEHIWDLYKELHGIRPRHLNFEEMSVSEMENLHHSLTGDLERHAEEEDELEWMEDRFHQDQDPGGDWEDWRDVEEEEAAYEAERQLMRTPESEYDLSPTRGHARRLSEHLTRSTIRKMILEAVRNVYREASDPADVTQVGDDDDPSTLDADDLRATADDLEAESEEEVPSLDLGLTRRQTEITEYLNSAGFEHGISYEWDPHDEESIIVLQDSMGDFEDDYDMIFHYLDREGYNPFSRGDTINLGQDPQSGKM